jgi:hypothetical protein
MVLVPVGYSWVVLYVQSVCTCLDLGVFLAVRRLVHCTP